ncbi:EGF-like domain protein [Ancylostoma caninum]|uniref:EGF-like domain protein n=1 Tax=Ancylostoma caninum TaxID=29170 RepID=A0A368FZ61_ANCCA|nr:EGF-like domain protein [Ancylostoma caninum]
MPPALKFLTLGGLLLLLTTSSIIVADELLEDELCDIETGSPCSAEDHEECKQQSGSDKIGVCVCINGYSREFRGAPCLLSNSTSALSQISTNITEDSSTPTNVIKFSVDGPDTVRLPADSVSAKVVIPSEDSTQEYSYLWELLQGSGLAFASSYKRSVLELSQLKPGSLQFRVTVSNKTHSGQQKYALTVEPPKGPNKPPKAIIRPESPVQGVEGSRLTLDAEGSIDDDKIVSYKWTQDKGPSIPLPAMNTPFLTLDNMVAGNYVFSVLVTDSGGLTSSASARVEIEAERDDPPKAHINECGSKEHSGSLTIRLPRTEVSLCGNGSLDDKGIVSYNWFRVDKLSEKLSVDLAGSTTSILTLRNIQANERLGPYEFQLDVTDTKGQKDSARIMADAGGNHTVILPESSMVLDGNAKDDGSITSYLWTQVDGPSEASLVNADKAKATASGLVEGVYQFLLTVVDDGGLNATASAFISVERSRNEPPVAKAPNVTVHLPTVIAILNASQSFDDAGIVAFHWQPFDDVPASMIALDGSEHRAVMFVTGLVEGTHLYNLTVSDQQKASDSIVVRLTVTKGEEETESVEILMKKDIKEWTYRLRRKLQDRIEASLAGSIEESDLVVVQFTRFEKLPQDGRLRAVFWARSHSKKENTMRHRRMISPDYNGVIIKAERAVEILRHESTMLSDFHISVIQPLYCKLDCSGHGVCNDATKQCECDSFWMGNIFAYLIAGLKSEDCAWSSVYFWIMFSSLTALITTCMLIRRRSSAMWNRVSRRRFRRRKRYSALRSESDDVEKEAYRMRNGPRLAPLPIPHSSESLDSESDELLHVSGGGCSLQKRERSSAEKVLS